MFYPSVVNPSVMVRFRVRVSVGGHRRKPLTNVAKLSVLNVCGDPGCVLVFNYHISRGFFAMPI